MNFHNIISWVLPSHKRKTLRVTWLMTLCKKIRIIHEEFERFVEDKTIEAKVNAITINFENYLNYRFGNGILIEHDGVVVEFKVKVPGIITYDEDELISVIDKYKIPGSTYQIETI